MSIIFRILLILGAIGTFLYFMIKIRKSKIQIEDAIFWFAFSFLIIILSIFPGILMFFAKLLSIQSPVNLLYLIIIFLLLIRIFTLNIKMSMLESKLKQLVQNIALKETKREESEKDEDKYTATK